MARSTGVRADQVSYALERRHRGVHRDLFFTEVKTGRTNYAETGELLRLDAVAIKPSWASPSITAYEVKVDRADFLRDEKWPRYRDFCHRLYFACPAGLIQPDELPEDVGLVWYNPETGALHTKRKALFRDIELPATLFYYLVLSRLEPERHPFFSSQREFIEAWVQDKKERWELGYHFRSRLVQQVEEAEKEARKAQGLEERYKQTSEELQALRSILETAGIQRGWRYGAGVEDQLRTALAAKVSPRVRSLAVGLAEQARELAEALREEATEQHAASD